MDNTQKPSKSNLGLIIGAVVLVLALIAGISYYFWNEQNNKEDVADNSSSSSVEQKEKGVVVGGYEMLASKDIVENTSNASNLSILVQSVQAGGLVEALKAEGPITVFGPENDAFSKLPAGTLDTLSKPENKMMLQKVLQFHVVQGKYTISELKDNQRLKTVSGEELIVYKKNGKTTVNGAVIKTPDALQKNGVIHVIDSVMLPPAEETLVGGVVMSRNKSIVENVVNAPNLTTVVKAIETAGLLPTLGSETGDFTVFGPENDAFSKLPAGTLDNLLKPENKESLAGVLTYHVVVGRYSISQMYDGQKLTTAQGQTLTVNKLGNKTTITGGSAGNVATIVTPDVFQKNGVAHVIDTVLLPPAN